MVTPWAIGSHDLPAADLIAEAVRLGQHPLGLVSARRHRPCRIDRQPVADPDDLCAEGGVPIADRLGGFDRLLARIGLVKRTNMMPN